jgi:hypothetical protein
MFAFPVEQKSLIKNFSSKWKQLLTFVKNETQIR